MTPLNIILILILAVFIFFGLFFGLVRMIGSLAGTIIGVILAFNFFEVVASPLKPYIHNDNLSAALGWLIVFVVASQIVYLIFKIIGKIFNLPILKAVNHLGGAIFGFIEGVFILSTALVFVVRFPFAASLIPAIESSSVAKQLFDLGASFLPILPELFKQAKSLVNFAL